MIGRQLSAVIPPASLTIFRGMLQRGIYLAPSQFEAGFVSAMHTAAISARTLEKPLWWSLKRWRRLVMPFALVSFRVGQENFVGGQAFNFSWTVETTCGSAS